MFKFRRIQSNNRDLMQVQDAVDQVLKPVLTNQLLNGVLIPNLSLTTTPVKFSHLLGRQPLGWFLVDDISGAAIYRTAWDARTISLRTTSGTNTISIWVF